MTLPIRWRPFTLAAFATAGLIAGCGAGTDASSIYTLYRDSVAGESMRVHVATFDAAENDQYNRSNCEQAQNLFQKGRCQDPLLV